MRTTLILLTVGTVEGRRRHIGPKVMTVAFRRAQTMTVTRMATPTRGPIPVTVNTFAALEGGGGGWERGARTHILGP